MPVSAATSPRALRVGATLFATGVFLISWWHWWSYQYTTFDLAFYVQSLWLAGRGEWWVSLLQVPLLGNHAEPIVFLLTPFFALWPHPMLFVLVQTIALASMAFTGARIAERLGVPRRGAIALGLTLLVIPGTSSVGLHEFHPEALAAPLLLLLFEARLAEKLGRYWLWFLALLATKENLALLLVAFAIVMLWLDRRRGAAWQWRWNGRPLLAAAAWLGLYGAVLSPWLNGGQVDYGELYSHLGRNGGEIVRSFFTQPQLALGQLGHALTHGDMLWSLLLPLLLLPLLRPHWFVIAAPLLLQHLLSSRASEWSLGSHYTAPFIALFWIAAVEVLPRFRRAETLAFGILGASALAHFFCGPAHGLIAEIPHLGERLEERVWKSRLLAEIPATASVTAAQPYLSHLAHRRQLYSLHHVLKGLKTLSRQPYTPPPTDFVVIDYADTSTFSTVAGFYHPPSRPEAERAVPSSDRLLHEFLRPHRWRVDACNSFALYRRGEPLAPFPPDTPPVPFDATTTLLNLQLAPRAPRVLRARMAWRFEGERERFPWLMLVLSDGRRLYPIVKGLCAPDAGAGEAFEDWLITLPGTMPATHYEMFALFYDGLGAAWSGQLPPGDLTHALKRIQVGTYDAPPAP